MKVHELLDSPDKWTQYAMARNENEEVVLSNSPDAVKWCLLGAIDKCYPYLEDKIIYKIYDISNTSIGDFNDSHSYEEVMELVRKLDI